jgi:pilus assembly protein CpaE
MSSEEEMNRGVELVRDRAPDIAVLDVEGDPAGALSAAEELTRSAPGTLLVAACRADTGTAFDGRDDLIALMRAGVRDFLRRPISARELDEVLMRQVIGSRKGGATGQVVCFAGNKGGVGKSTLAVNAAAMLARRHPGRVLLVDASLQLGVCASMLDLDPETTLTDAARELYRLDETLLRNLAVEHDCGLELLAAPRDAAEAAAIDETAFARILSTARRTYDWVIIDSFPLLDGIAMTGLDLAARVWVVMTSAVPTLRGSASFLRIIDRLGVPPERVRIALNSPQPRFAGALSMGDVADRINRRVDAALPFNKRILVAADLGQPFGLRRQPLSRTQKALHTIVKDIENLSPVAPRPKELES